MGRSPYPNQDRQQCLAWIATVLFASVALVPSTAKTPGGETVLVPQQIRDYYGVSQLIQAGYTGRGVAVAVVGAAIDRGFASEVEYFSFLYGLPPVNISAAYPNGSNGTLSNRPTGYTKEAAEDVEMVHAMAPNSRIILVLVGNVSATKAFSFLTDNNSADIATYSLVQPFWGTGAREAVESFDQELARSVQENISLISISGDWGSNNTLRTDRTMGSFWTDNLPDSYLMPTYDPYVTVVGGTQFILGPSGIAGETGWNRSGGGPSNLFAQPTWQVAPGVPRNGYRDIPDLSLDASCETPYAVFTYQTHSDCGTSLAAPVFAGMMADIEQAAGHRLGLLNPSLYSLASKDPSAFHDITAGYSLVQVGSTIEPGYCAAPRWDFVTGLGTPDAVKLLHYFAPSTAINEKVVPHSSSASSSSSEVSNTCLALSHNGLQPYLILAMAVGLVMAGSAIVLTRRHRSFRKESGPSRARLDLLFDLRLPVARLYPMPEPRS